MARAPQAATKTEISIPDKPGRCMGLMLRICAAESSSYTGCRQEALDWRSECGARSANLQPPASGLSVYAEINRSCRL